jgi:hypothetical protein
LGEIRYWRNQNIFRLKASALNDSRFFVENAETLLCIIYNPNEDTEFVLSGQRETIGMSGTYAEGKHILEQFYSQLYKGIPVGTDSNNENTSIPNRETAATATFLPKS